MSRDEVGTPRETWQEIAKEVARESDPRKLSALISKLNALMFAEERRKVIQRLERKRDLGKSAA